MMIVLLVISILAFMAVPDLTSPHTQKQIRESTDLVDSLKTNINQYYITQGTFPTDNENASLPVAEKIIGNYIKSATVENGAIHLKFGNKVTKTIDGKILSLRPIYVEDSPASPISWVCGADSIPPGMKAAGNNKTDIESKLLPIECRGKDI